jgi:Leucine-rich repeat (LRR) protein
MQELKPAINAQEYLNEKYPNKVDRAKLTELKISCKSLEGPLDLSDFVNLEALFCYYNYLTYLNIEKCQKLEVIECASNLIEADLNIFSCLINLKKLDLGLHITGVGVPGKITTEKDQVQPGTKRKQQPFSDSLDCQNNFYGSLKSLENCQQLEFLCIALQKNVKGGLEYLPTEKLR